MPMRAYCAHNRRVNWMHSFNKCSLLYMNVCAPPPFPPPPIERECSRIIYVVWTCVVSVHTAAAVNLTLSPPAAHCHCHHHHLTCNWPHPIKLYNARGAACFGSVRDVHLKNKTPHSLSRWLQPCGEALIINCTCCAPSHHRDCLAVVALFVWVDVCVVII